MKNFLRQSALAATLLTGSLAWSAIAPTKAMASNEDHIVMDVAIGKACWVEAYTNSAAVWTMTITNGEELAAVFKGSGVNFAPMKVVKGSARFDVKGGVQAKFTSGTGKAWVKAANGVIASNSKDPAVFGTLMGGEDGGDDDWQDIVANVTCLHHAG